jgi:ADP-ribose pyrophosphatase YjhB (NUDIX family)
MDLFALLDDIQTIARNGLHYSRDPYDRERYARLLSLAAQTYTAQLDLPDEAIRARFRAEFGHITPKVGASAAIFNEQGHILLMDRADGHGWCLPCGWVEPNERPAEAAVRETREETGLTVTVRQLVGVFTRMADGRYGPHTLVSIVHLCNVVGGELTLSHEGLALRYWPLEAVGRWFATHEQYARAAHAMWQSDRPLPAISN